MAQITTISFFKFTTLRSKMWAFFMMQFAHGPMGKVPGLIFYKLMGTGKAGFNPLPDWSVYAIVQVWEDETHAEAFFSTHLLYKRYNSFASENWVLFMENIMAKGSWDGKNPFLSTNNLPGNLRYVAAITRATIKTKRLYSFWRYVPKSQAQLKEKAGLMYTKGIGEMPFKQMATFSLWENEAALKSFAYSAQGHVGAIAKTRALDWYKEELFARFRPYKSLGSWEGKNPFGSINTLKAERA